MSDITYALSDATRSAIAALVEAEIAHEYQLPTIDGQDTALVRSSARIVAETSLDADARDAFIAFTGGDHGLNGWVSTELRILVRDGLAARECQCRQLPNAGMFRGHDHNGRICERHYEADVPAVNGLLLCGTCYCADPDVVED